MGVPKIMIAERDAVTAMDIEECLAEMGCRTVAVVRSGREAIRMALKVLPDLVLLDVDVQRTTDGVDGELKLFEALKAPIVFISDRSCHRVEIGLPYYRYGGQIQKPSGDWELKAAVQAALQRGNRLVATQWEACCVPSRS